MAEEEEEEEEEKEKSTMVTLEINHPQVSPPVLPIICSNAASAAAATSPIRSVEVMSAFTVTRPQTAGGVGEKGIIDPLSAWLAAASQC